MHHGRNELIFGAQLVVASHKPPSPWMPVGWILGRNAHHEVCPSGGDLQSCSGLSQAAVMVQ